MNIENQTRKKQRKRPALIPVPDKLAFLFELVNLLPHGFRKSPPQLAKADPEMEPSVYFWRVRDSWFNQTDDQNALNSMFHLQRLVDTLPLALQAFVLNDDHGRFNQYVENDAPTLLPYFDFHHYQQPLTNIVLLRQPEKELRATVARAKERIEIEVNAAGARIDAGKGKPSRKGSLIQAISPAFVSYEVGNSSFTEAHLCVLAERARQRFFFILAAEELLDALVGPETQRKLDDAWYCEMSGATRSFPYVTDDQVTMIPPVLFEFVMGVQVSRIRRCGVCNNYFWAGRKDKKVCSPRCSATSRKRQERQRYFEIKTGVRRRKSRRRKEN